MKHLFHVCFAVVTSVVLLSCDGLTSGKFLVEGLDKGTEKADAVPWTIEGAFENYLLANGYRLVWDRVTPTDPESEDIKFLVRADLTNPESPAYYEVLKADALMTWEQIQGYFNEYTFTVDDEPLKFEDLTEDVDTAQYFEAFVTTYLSVERALTKFDATVTLDIYNPPDWENAEGEVETLTFANYAALLVDYNGFVVRFSYVAADDWRNYTQAFEAKFYNYLLRMGYRMIVYNGKTYLIQQVEQSFFICDYDFDAVFDVATNYLKEDGSRLDVSTPVELNPNKTNYNPDLKAKFEDLLPQAITNHSTFNLFDTVLYSIEFEYVNDAGETLTQTASNLFDFYNKWDYFSTVTFVRIFR